MADFLIFELVITIEKPSKLLKKYSRNYVVIKNPEDETYSILCEYGYIQELKNDLGYLKYIHYSGHQRKFTEILKKMKDKIIDENGEDEIIFKENNIKYFEKALEIKKRKCKRRLRRWKKQLFLT